MALLKEIETSHGFTANYWVVGRIEIEAKRLVLVQLYLYKDEASRRAGKDPILTQEYREMRYTFEPIPSDFANIISWCYAQIKGIDPIFADATDI